MEIKHEENLTCFLEDEILDIFSELLYIIFSIHFTLLFILLTRKLTKMQWDIFIQSIKTTIHSIRNITAFKA
jgi:hypothetical protein